MESTTAFAAMLAFIAVMTYLALKRKKEDRDMRHRERMMALEKGIPLMG